MEPSLLSLLPPLVAIALAIILRQVVLALFTGVFLGALLVYGNPIDALLRSVDHYLVGSAADSGHASILLFTFFLGGMVGVVSKSGGAAGLASWVTRFAKSPRSGALGTWLLGLLIFFDDYANSLLVGSAMRPITDKLRMSREKLAFLIDATAAPVSSIAVVSSWVGVEVGYIAEQYKSLGLEGDGYVIFLETLPYRFYPILMIFFVFALVWQSRDFGPMAKAERRAWTTGQVLRPGAQPAAEFGDDGLLEVEPRAINAWFPILTVVVVASIGMWALGVAGLEPGMEVTFRNVLGATDSTKALLWGSFMGCLAALVCAVGTRSLKLEPALDAWMGGLKAMLPAGVILVLAWALGQVCKDVKTADFVIQVLGKDISPVVFPAAVFVISGAVAFATGTSWGTMAILFPLVVPLAHHVAQGNEHIMLGAIASILTGSVWGDHCSPISDTTILSSLASACDHIDHVRTQLPYALAVGGIAVVLGDVGSAAFGYSPWVGLMLGAAACWGLVRFVGRPIHAQPQHAESQFSPGSG